MHLCFSALLLAVSMIPGLYQDQNGRWLYAALDVEDAPVVNWIDPENQHDGVLPNDVASAAKGLRKAFHRPSAARPPRRFFILCRPPAPRHGYPHSPKMKIPPPQSRIDALRRADVYDPTQTLQRVTVPTLALYGALDRAVDTAHDAPKLQRAFKIAGMTDFTLHVYPQAGHSLFVSQTGYPDQRSAPRRRVPGYTQTFIGWLQTRGFAKPSPAG